jgi:VWFA-related protein
MSGLLLLLLLAQEQPTFRSDVELIHVDAEVREGGRPIEGLGKESFRVTDEGKPQTIVEFGHEEEPFDVIWLFDARGEMRPDVKRAAEAAHTALSDLRAGDRIAVMGFGFTASECKTDLISDFTGDFGAAERSIGNQLLQQELGSTGLGFCPTMRGLDGAAQHFLGQPNANRRRTIIIITDDKLFQSSSDAVRGAVRDLWKADAVVLGVIVHSGEHALVLAPYRGVGYAADRTGGDILRTNDAAEGLRDMMHRLRTRYSLYYALPQGRSGGERKIRVQLAPDAAKRYPRAVVRARTGYVVPGGPSGR